MEILLIPTEHYVVGQEIFLSVCVRVKERQIGFTSVVTLIF